MAGPKLDPEILAHLEWLGFVRPSSRKLTWRCEHAAAIASWSCEIPRRFRQ